LGVYHGIPATMSSNMAGESAQMEIFCGKINEHYLSLYLYHLYNYM
jgi:hypothetical protein